MSETEGGCWRERARLQTQTIKSCPFCGEEERIYPYISETYPSRHFVGCVNCRARGPETCDSKEAIRMWNYAPRNYDSNCE